jgi:hypothetical protein
VIGGTGPVSNIINQFCIAFGNLNSIPIIGPTIALFVTTACTQLAMLFSAVGL